MPAFIRRKTVYNSTLQPLIMEVQVKNLCLLNMPTLVIEKILSNIHNLFNVARTCKYFYEIVCGVDKYRRVMQIKGTLDATGRSTVSIKFRILTSSFGRSINTNAFLKIKCFLKNHLCMK